MVGPEEAVNCERSRLPPVTGRSWLRCSMQAQLGEFAADCAAVKTGLSVSQSGFREHGTLPSPFEISQQRSKLADWHVRCEEGRIHWADAFARHIAALSGFPQTW